MNEPDIEKQLIQWNLFKAYGEFNIRFEAIVASFHDLLIILVKSYYGFEVEWEDKITQEPLPESLQDRLLKIILHDDGAMSIIEKGRSCFMDITSLEVKTVLISNNIKPIQISDFDIKFGHHLFKKAQQIINLRNILIHSHFEGSIFDWLPITTLKGSRDKKIAKGYEQQIHEFDIGFLEKINQSLELFEFYVNQLKYHFTLSKGEDRFSQKDYDIIADMDFQTQLNIKDY